MNTLLDLRDKLQETHAAMALLRSALGAEPAEELLSLTAESLVRRQEQLEAAFAAAAGKQYLDICAYRLIPEAADSYPLLGITKILGEFQQLVTTVFDALKTQKPKTRARVAPELVQLSSFDFGYVAPGSLERSF